MKVLVVEDEFIVRFDAALQFEDEGFEVTATGSADEALQILPDSYDVVFTDINMPGHIDGLELAHQVRARWPDVKVIITSGRKCERSALPEDAMFIPKPYQLDRVVQTIRGF